MLFNSGLTPAEESGPFDWLFSPVACENVPKLLHN